MKSPRPTAAPRCKTAFAQGQPDVVLLDVNLRRRQRAGIAAAGQKALAGTEVIILTGAPSDNEAVSWAVEADQAGRL